MNQNEFDTKVMGEALALAHMGWGLTNPNPMVGAVLCKNGEIIGRGFHRCAGEAHAEINTLRDAEHHHIDVRGSTLYVTLEPCSTFGRTPPCTEAIINAGISRVVIGALDPNPKHNGQGVAVLRAAGIEVTTGVESITCAKLNQSFFKWITAKMPFVMLKMGMTLDGKISTCDGESKWITGQEARKRVQKLRRMADAIMVGASTVRNDHPLLTVREPENWERQPLRIIVSHSMKQDELSEYFPEGRAEVVDLPKKESWHNYFMELGKRQIMAVLIEGGGEIANAALRAGVVDMVEFHIAPKLLGGRESRPVLGGDNPQSISDALLLDRLETQMCGNDIIVRGYPRKEE